MKNKSIFRLLGTLLVGISLSFASVAIYASDDVKLILLGTKGGPSIAEDKRLPQSATLMIGDDIYMIDAGYGASLRLVQAGAKLTDLKGIFITHLHADHVLDYPSLLMNSWATGLKDEVSVYGPEGTRYMTDSLWEAFKVDIDLRIPDEGKPDIRKLVKVQEIQEDNVCDCDGGKLKVSALPVPHPPFKFGQAFAYKFEVGGKVIVMTGDMNYYPPFEKFAKDADVLVSEVVNVPAVEALAERLGGGDKFAHAIISHHITGQDVGRMASAANVKKVVLTHFVPANDPSLTDTVWRDSVKQNYDGPVVVGHDGMKIDIIKRL
ncbi:MBL fold metallo-hydrolase [Cobetia crustatorum]|uniref:MBL fold metallo-hydrolase n=1 Tax=Cobetia crustatorum TaxID=553385 RepID=UPI0004696FD4|nr:MBL fold metallo-hydrolase [Cobetia crustatorum]